MNGPRQRNVFFFLTYFERYQLKAASTVTMRHHPWNALSLTAVLKHLYYKAFVVLQ